jgi:hypothetical protein
MWNQAGSCRLRNLDSFLGAKERFHFFAVFNSLMTKWGVCLLFFFVLPVGRSVVRKVLISFWGLDAVFLY